MNPGLATSGFAAAWPPESLATRSSLLSRLRDLGDEANWRTFFDTYWLLLYNVARKSGLRDADAQDVVQETIIGVARKMPEFRYDPAKGSFKNWLLLITRRRIQDHLRKLYRSLPGNRGERANNEVREVAAAEVLTPDEQIDAAWEAEWRNNFFQTALARVRQRVKPKVYQAFDYCVSQNLRASEVARMLGLSAAQVYLAKHRVGRALKAEMIRLERELAQVAQARKGVCAGGS
jgi:RNA polymerase sigma-70 factor (ECF subfamily)